MRRLIICMLLLVVVMAPVKGANAGWFSAEPLLTINERQYSTDDYKHWWQHWNNKGDLDISTGMETFIDYNLLVQEGRDMEYDRHPAYLAKIKVFLKFRALMALKYEEVDKKIDVTEEDLRSYFKENYAPLWSIQLLTFEDLKSAEIGYQNMQSYNGSPAGQLVFADLQSAPGVVHYDEATVSPDDVRSNKKEAWLETIRELKEGFVASPFELEDSGKYILLRVSSISQPAESVYEAKKSLMRNIIYKNLRNSLTSELLGSLMKKYNYVADKELIAEVDPDKEYDTEFLQRKIISMDDLDITVADLINNIRRDMKNRPGAEISVVKDIVISNIISNTLVDKEALARHYEAEEPLKWTWEFYKDNRLRTEVLSRIKNKIDVSGDEIRNHYEVSQDIYGTPESVVFRIIAADQELINKIWAGVLQGEDFVETGMKYGQEAILKKSTTDKDGPEVRKVLDGMKKGMVSAPFVYLGKSAIIQFLDRTEAQVVPLEKVRGTIEEKIREEKYKIVKAEYMQQLRQRSNIKTNNELWNKLKEELK